MRWINGYRRRLEGSPFPYHSFAPEIRSALLVRANREHPAVTWETAPLDPDGEVVHVTWVFAMAATADGALFTLHANDEPLLTFTNPTSADTRGWTVHGRDGASLEFRVTYRSLTGREAT